VTADDDTTSRRPWPFESLEKSFADDEDAPDAARDVLAQIRRFAPVGDRDHRAAYSVPHFLHVAPESVVALMLPWRTNVTHVGVWAHARGVCRLGQLPDVQAIRDAREDLLRRGCDTAYVDEWRYLISPHGHRSRRLYLRRLDPAAIGHFTALASGLGLEISIVATLATMAALVDVPLRGDIPRVMEAELRDWLRSLRRRAALVTDLRDRAVAAPEPPERATWAALRAEEDR